jgi:hypothetical protein
MAAIANAFNSDLFYSTEPLQLVSNEPEITDSSSSVATVGRVHFSNQGIELLACGQRGLFPANCNTFQSRCRIAVNHTSFDCDVQNVSKKCDRVVVVSRRRSFGVRARPFFAIHVRDLTDLCFIQSWAAFLEGSKALLPILARARFDAQVVIEIPEMNLSRLAECHFGRHFTIAIADALTVFFEKFSELGLRYAEM